MKKSVENFDGEKFKKESKVKKIGLFKDRDDYIITKTHDEVINVIGTKGSGKTTSTIKYLNDDNYIVINCDRLFDLPSDEKKDKELIKIREMLKDKYKTLTMDMDFINCYNDIIDYILSKNKKCIIEGNIIQSISPELLKGKVIIKRTSVIKSYIRSVKRDYKNKYFMELEKEKHKYLYKLTRLYKIAKRRIKVFKQAKDIENIIVNLEMTTLQNN